MDQWRAATIFLHTCICTLVYSHCGVLVAAGTPAAAQVDESLAAALAGRVALGGAPGCEAEGA